MNNLIPAFCLLEINSLERMKFSFGGQKNEKKKKETIVEKQNDEFFFLLIRLLTHN